MRSAAVLESVSFDLGGVGERLLDQAYRILAALPMLAISLAIVGLSWFLGSWIARHTSFRRLGGRNPFLKELVQASVRGAILLFGVLVALELMQATALVGAVLGTAGVLGVALGFAFKDILENYLAGILMSLRQPFSPRDHVVIDGNEGVIVALTSRATILMTLDGNHLRMPNAMVFRSVMLNYTRNPKRRFEFDVGVGVQEDLVAAQRIGVEELRDLEGVLDDPPPRAMIVALGDSNVQVRYFGWMDQRSHDFGSVKSEAIRGVKLKLEEAGMDMPEPIYRLQVTRPSAVVKPAPAKKTHEPAPSVSSARLDTSANQDVQAQLQVGREITASEDLLDPAAPKE